VEVSLSSESKEFKTPDGDSIRDRNGNLRFLYFSKGTLGAWNQWGFVFSDPAPTVFSGEIDEVELPRGIFDDTTGEYIDEDNNGTPDYFQHLDLRTYEGDQIFDSWPDPTAGADGRDVIYVNGNITITGVDFGYLNDQGEVKFCDWEKRDLVFIANGDITVNQVDCGNVGRLVLVAKNITLLGDYNTKVNGIAVAFSDITLDGSGCRYGSYYGILTHPDTSRSVKYTAYFLGSMVARNHIKLLSEGWAVIYDENVINGNMYSTTISKPTLTYERVEVEDFNLSNNWQVNESLPQMLYTQGIYTQDEKDTMQGDYSDGGEDTVPEVMRVYTDHASWGPKGPHALGEILSLDFTSADFEDPDISDLSLQDWDYYDTITLWMALDNLKRTSTDGTKATRREARYDIRLKDGGGNTISIPLNSLYPEAEWGTVRYHHTGEDYMNEIRDLTATEKANGEAYSKWKRIEITPNDIDPGVNFGFSNVEEFAIAYTSLKLSWTVEVGKSDAKVEWRWGHFRYTNENGTYRSIDNKYMQGDLYNDPPAPNDGYYYLVDDSSAPWFWIRWIEDPDSSTEVRMREEVLMPTLRIDRTELPGKPATNNYLEYGLPHCLRLDVTNWSEL